MMQMPKFLTPPRGGLLLALLLALSLAGCAVGPDYVKPQLALPLNYSEQWKVAQPIDDSPRGAWWEVYQDPQLQALMDTLNQQSPSIAQAEAQYRQAAALLRQANAGLFPSVAANASNSRGVSTPGQASGPTYNVGATASWEADVWGGVRRAVEAGAAKQAVSAAQLAAVQLSSQAQLATAYLQLIVADEQLRQLQESEATLQATLTFTRHQYAAGIVSEASVAQADSQWQSAQALRVDKQLTRSQLEHAIATATGQMALTIPARPTLSARPHLPQISAGLPSALLERRPDIAAAERSMAAANAQIGVAKSAFYPNLTLTASGGYRSSTLANWISMPSRIWSIGPQLALSLFDAGLLRAQTDQVIASYDASVASYRLTVLAAFQSVQDTLIAQALLAQEATLQTAALSAAQRSETITLNQYRAGTVSYINVLAAQNSRITAEGNLWSVINRQYTNSVALIAAIGGQW